MSFYEFVEILAKLSVVAGVCVAACAFMLPRGWKSPLGLLALALGASIIVSGLTHGPDGRTWAKVVLSRLFLE